MPIAQIGLNGASVCKGQGDNNVLAWEIDELYEHHYKHRRATEQWLAAADLC